ncbi:MAG: hypothetical protein H7Z19_03115 [Chitinophagaceae bacterium]|nr:hypothetical protein [Rubrivivax sp.]
MGPTTRLRAEVFPPALRQAPASGWQRAMFWLLAPAPQESAPPRNRLPGVRLEFMRALADIDDLDVERVRNRVALSQSLRELWHLRTDVYRAIGLAHTQREAETRLGLLNRHFPCRAPRSQFGAL